MPGNDDNTLSERFRLCGINDKNLNNVPCYVSGQDCSKASFAFSGFVANKQAGDRVIDMFNGKARLDYNPSDEKYVRVRVGVTGENLPALEQLYILIHKNGEMITPGIIAEAKLAAPAPVGQ